MPAPTSKAEMSGESFWLSEADETRELIDDEKRVDVLMGPMSDSCRHIRLSGKSLGILAANHISKRISQLQGPLHTADLSDIIASRPEEDAKKVLNILATALRPHGETITRVDLSDNALGVRGVRACAPLLNAARTTLTHLTVNNNGLESRATKLIAEIMTGIDAGRLEKELVSAKEDDDDEEVIDLGEPTNLLQFHTFNNLIESAGTAGLSHLIRQSPNLTDLRISSTRIKTEGCLALADACAESSQGLVRLDLSDNSFMAEGIEDLSIKAIPKMTSLQYLNLSATGMGDEGFQALSSGLIASRAPLTHLDISCNELSSDCADVLGKMLSSLRRTLVTMLAAENELKNSGAVSIMVALASSNTVKTIDISVNEITEIGATAMAAKLPTSLERFEVNGNLISAAGIEAMRDALPAGCILGDIDLNDEDYEEDADEDQIDLDSIIESLGDIKLD